MDDIKRQAIRAERLDPDNPAVAAALELVRLELALFGPERVTKVPKSRQTFVTS
jgi:hypothetical protein